MGKADVQHTAGGDNSVEERRLAMEKKKDLARGDEIGGTDNATRIRGEKAGRAEVATGRAQFEEENRGDRVSSMRENGERRELIRIVQQ